MEIRSEHERVKLLKYSHFFRVFLSVRFEEVPAF